VALAPLIVGLFLQWLWPSSAAAEEYEKSVVTGLERHGKRVSFDLPDPLKPGKLRHVKFRAKSIDEAEQIEQALQKTQSSAP
jgi:hypothetical protein